MKKFILFIAVGLMSFVGVNAQSEGKKYGPEKGDVALGFNLNTVLQHAGVVFGNESIDDIDNVGGQPVSAGIDNELLPEVSLMGKYMLNETWGIRANVGLMLGSDVDKAYVKDDKLSVSDPLNESKLIDTRKTSRNGMSLMLGGEYRVGENRVQGVFGAGVIFGFVSEKTTYKYANAITEINNKPTTADWASYDSYGYRPLKNKSEKGLFYGVTGSAGVEWFLAPKVSLGAEVNLSLYYIDGGQVYKESEGYNTSTKQVEERTDLTSPGNNKFRFGTENLGGSLYMAFYF